MIPGDGNTSKFYTQLSERAKPIRDLLSLKNEWQWGDQQQKILWVIKQDLILAPVQC